ncbi:hypothetical protein ACXR0O_08835 [Verrucomicrobiota bacterium sgz303538]
MAAKLRYQPLKALSLAQQAAGLKAAFPSAHVTIERGVLKWRDWLQPMAFSMRYWVEITYQLRERPKTRVLEPDFSTLVNGGTVPHLYSQTEQELCLFYPDGREWNASKSLDRTIVAWASEWIVHFESWLFTGEWDGGGVHPIGGGKKSERVVPLL